MKEKNNNISEKEYILTYKSQEHFEVLGWVRAKSLEEAKKTAQIQLLIEAKRYNVKEAEIAEWGENSIVAFKF
jgi:hypothetical protein